MNTDWSRIETELNKLLEQNIENLEQFNKWITLRSKLYAEFEEAEAWLYIKTTTNTKDKQALENYNYFISNIKPKFIQLNHKLNQKIIKLPFLSQIEKHYPILIRKIRNELKLYREENIPLFTQDQKLANQYNTIVGGMSITWQGQKLPITKAVKYLFEPDRKLRKIIYNKIIKRRLKDYHKINRILDKQIQIRHQIAKNAGYKNYRDYKHDELQRFDYTVDNVITFNKNIADTVVPIVERFRKRRRQLLKVKTLKPYDLNVDIFNKPALKPFETIDEFIEKAIATLSSVRPKYGQMLSTMYQKGYLDLEAREGKAPGGYNYPLYVSNVPFIFMNASGTVDDVITIMHEAGHAIHSFLMKDLKIIEYKETPSEIAELASMSMELISMEHWDKFFEDSEQLRRAKIYQLSRVLCGLPSISLIDSFQHWLYTKPGHNSVERYAKWLELSDKYITAGVDWTEYEWALANHWQRVMHIFEVPFYYIEYAFAQLGAIAIWMNYKKDPEKTLDNYENALALGYSKTIPEVYQTAGIEFNFSKMYVKKLINFVWEELKNLIDDGK